MRAVAGMLPLALAVFAAGCRNFDDPAPTFAVSPPSFSFTARAGGEDSPSQPLLVDLRGSGRLVWQATADVVWLRITQTGDTAPATALIVAVPGGLSVGRYAGRVTVTAAGVSVTVPVTFELTAVPSFTGRWAFLADTINVGLSLEESTGVVTGSGNFNAPNIPRRHFSVQGASSPPAVSLTLTQTDGTRSTLTGSFVNDNVVDAVLDGGNFVSARVLLFRQ